MPDKFNNGEWCELYAPAKVMLTGELPLCDANLNLTGNSIDVLSLDNGNTRIARDKDNARLTIRDKQSGADKVLLDFAKLEKILRSFWEILQKFLSKNFDFVIFRGRFAHKQLFECTLLRNSLSS